MIDKFEDKYSFLSNFYYSPFALGDKGYFTVENYFQSMKAADPTEAEKIRLAHTPGQSKRLGRRCKIREDWEELKDEVMYEGVKAKFLQNPALKNKLLNTGNEYLQEGNTWHDNEWGACYCVNCQDIMAKNKLGKILMRVRGELREN